MQEFYSPEEYALGYPEGIESHFWNVARNHTLLRIVRGLNIGNGLIMDVGCGLGIATSFLHQQGYNIRGIELGQPPVPAAAQSYIDTGKSLFEQPVELKSEITCVLLLDVIEHMADRAAFLQQLHQQLPNCRHLVVTVPARRELWSEFDSFWGHQLRYDRPELAGEISASGFTVQRNRYYFHALYLAALLLKLLGVTRSTTFKSPGKSWPAALAHTLLGLYGRLENRLVPGFVPGSSIICVATRH